MSEAEGTERSDETPQLPDYDLEAEHALLGYLLLKPQEVGDVARVVQQADFFDILHRKVFETLVAANERGESATIDKLCDALGGRQGKLTSGTVEQFVVSLATDVQTVNPIELADYIAQCAEQRMTAAAYDPEPLRFASLFGGMRWEDIGTDGSILAYRWLIEDIVPLGEIALVFGESGSGKSFGIFDLAVKVAMGRKFAGRNVEGGLVVYVAAEAGKGFSKRKVAYSIYHNIQPDAAVPFYLCTRRPDFFSSDDDAEKLIQEIMAVCRAYGKDQPVLIVLDTLSALAPGMNENASQDVSMLRKRLNMVQRQFPNAAIILVHHKPKNGNTPRGHGSLTADFETTLEFEKLTVRDSHGLLIHRGTVRKQREGKSGISWEFTLPVFDVGRNKWGNKETSCVAVPYESVRATTGGYKPSNEQKLFLECLWRALTESSVPAPIGLDASARYTQLATIRQLMKAQMISGEEDTARADGRFRTAFKRSGDALRNAGIIRHYDGVICFTGAAIQGMTFRIEEEASAA